METTMYPDLVSDIMDWEGGVMSEEAETAFFQRLKDSGMIYHLQGCYQRRMRDLIGAGLVK